MDSATMMALSEGGGSILQSLTGLGQGVYGYIERKRAMKGLAGLEDPTMELPSSITQMIDLARRREEMPGLETMKDELGAVTGRGLTQVARSARTPGELARATSNLYAEEMRGARQLDIAGAEYRAAREKELMGALRTQAGYEQEMFRVNEMLPYQRRLNQYMEQARMGGQNIAAGLGTLTQAATGAAESGVRMQMHKDWMDIERSRTSNPSFQQNNDQWQRSNPSLWDGGSYG